ncbi:MAG: GIDE domain-containing protein [Candidatus Micrarchaeota archaeon]|nr:GIDE domain-containing protein [Candidatus Micrarchaeota archaeon]
MDATPCMVVPIIFTAGGAVFTVVGVRMWTAQKKEDDILGKMQKTQMSRVSGISEGMTKIRGKVAAINALKAKYTDNECVYYRSVEERYERVSGGKHSHYGWVPVSEEIKSAPFYLEDDSEKVLVNLGGIEGNWADAESVISEPSEPGVEASLAIGGHVFGKNSRKREWIIRPGAELFVYGFAKREGQLTIKKEQDFPLIASIRDESELVKLAKSDNPINKIAAVFFIIFGSIFFLAGLVMGLAAFVFGAAFGNLLPG